MAFPKWGCVYTEIFFTFFIFFDELNLKELKAGNGWKENQEYICIFVLRYWSLKWYNNYYHLLSMVPLDEKTTKTNM